MNVKEAVRQVISAENAPSNRNQLRNQVIQKLKEAGYKPINVAEVVRELKTQLDGGTGKPETTSLHSHSTIFS